MHFDITLRDLNQDDEPHLVRHLNNPNITAHLSAPIPYPYEPDDARWWINVGSKQGIVKAISIDEQFIGLVGAKMPEKDSENGAELGYWIGEEYWGRGIATRAVLAFTDWLTSATPIVFVFNPVTSINFASVRVMEKAGFQIETVNQNAFHKLNCVYDEIVFSKKLVR